TIHRGIAGLRGGARSRHDRIHTVGAGIIPDDADGPKSDGAPPEQYHGPNQTIRARRITGFAGASRDAGPWLHSAGTLSLPDYGGRGRYAEVRRHYGARGAGSGPIGSTDALAAVRQAHSHFYGHR